jgi:hypothetical protein
MCCEQRVFAYGTFYNVHSGGNIEENFMDFPASVVPIPKQQFSSYFQSFLLGNQCSGRRETHFLHLTF